jgi:hypothetical protein
VTAGVQHPTAGQVPIDLPSPRAVARVLVIVGAILVGLGIVASLLERSDLEIAGRENIITLLSLKSEYNIPTVVSVLELAACALLLTLIAAVQRARGDRFVSRWVLLSGIFLYLALDEGARLHERLNEPLAALPFTTGVLRWGWVLVGGLLVVVLAATYLRFVLALPSTYRTGVVVAGGLYVGGALMMELVGAGASENSGLDTPLYLTLTIVEEALELAGIGLFIVVLWSLLRLWAPQTVLRHRPPVDAEPQRSAVNVDH